MKYVLTKSIELPSNPPIKIPQYLIKDALLRTILVINLEMDLPKKYNLNLGYILTKALDLDNQENVLYKMSFNKLMNILWNNNFIITKS